MMTEPVIDSKLFEFSAFTYILHNNCDINIILWTTKLIIVSFKSWAIHLLLLLSNTDKSH